jgi:hypothetical protein
MSDEEPAPRDTRLSEEEISRLPPAVQLEMKLKQERMRGNSAEFVGRERNRTYIGAVFGFFAFLVAHLAVIDNYLLVGAIVLGGTAAGFFIVKQRLNFIIAMLLFGGVSIIGSMIALLIGATKPADLFFMIACWGGLCGLAVLLVNMMETDRRKREVFGG